MKIKAYITTKTKLRIWNSNVKSALFYGSETVSRTVSKDNKLQSFIKSSKIECVKKSFPYGDQTKSLMMTLNLGR